MYEQDIELARLLLSKLEELGVRGEELRTQLQQSEAELAQVQQQRDERAEYFDVLTRAAQLLERDDLRVDSPETSALEERVSSLHGELGDLDNEVNEYRRLADELRQRAPKLMVAAGSEGSAEAEEPAGLEPEDTAEEDRELYGNEPALEEEAGDMAGADSEADGHDQPGADDSDEPAAVDQPPAEETAEPGSMQPAASLESLFNVKDLKVKEAFTFGLGSTYIVDATSVLDRVPNYDMHYRALNESEVRDELIRDLERLSAELSGRFVVVFNSAHQPAEELSATVEIRSAGEGDKLAADDLITALARELLAVDKTACVVTGDSVLTELLEDDKIHVIALGEFFIT